MNCISYVQKVRGTKDIRKTNQNVDMKTRMFGMKITLGETGGRLNIQKNMQNKRLANSKNTSRKLSKMKTLRGNIILKMKKPSVGCGVVLRSQLQV